jgi:hypothetical protein
VKGELSPLLVLVSPLVSVLLLLLHFEAFGLHPGDRNEWNEERPVETRVLEVFEPSP